MTSTQLRVTSSDHVESNFSWYEIYGSETNHALGDVVANAEWNDLGLVKSFVHANLTPGDTWYYWVRSAWQRGEVYSELTALAPITIIGPGLADIAFSGSADDLIAGTVVMARGGTGAALTPSAGGIVYSTSTILAILAGVAAANRIPLSGNSAAPAWSPYAMPATVGASGNVLTSDGTNWLSSAPVGSAGLYTPTPSNVTNVAASTAYECQWSRNNNTVTVSGRVDIDPTAAPANTVLELSLPVASNFSAGGHCAGTAAQGDVVGQTAAAISANGTTNLARLTFQAVATTNDAWYFIFQYRVI